MCGISGLVGRFDEAGSLLARMNGAMSHRGPDQEGFFANTDAGVYLGHRRLSILDLSEAGRQPMARGGLVVVFNGEIYNYRDLRAELASAWAFTTQTDTEILLYGYADWGLVGLLERLRGMFAFALYDRDAGVLHLARDRMGEKPLYYATLSKGRFAFASELKVFRYLPETRTIDEDALGHYFSFGYVPAPLCLVQGCRKLQPGHYMTVDVRKGTAEERRYWQLRLPSEGDAAPRCEKEAAAHLRGLLERSVSRSLFSDVPLGVFLSGGLDSSLVASLAHRRIGGELHTFSVGYDEPSFDESPYARKMAAHLGSRHTELIVRSSEAKDIIVHLDRLVDEPMSDMSLVPTHLLSRKAREHVTVTLGGDGADELFAGYPTHLAHKLTAAYSWLPRPLRRWLIEPAVNALPPSYRDFSLEFRLKRFVASADLPPHLRHFAWQMHVPLADRGGFRETRPDTLRAVEDLVARFLPQGATDTFRRIEALDLHLYLSNDILAKVDIAAMACSLETRSPYLDADVVAYAYGLPERLKFRLRNQKYILKRVAEGLLPREIIYRKKHGFGMPIGGWLRGDLHGMVRDSLLSGLLERVCGIKHSYMERILEDHRQSRADNRKQIWSLYVLNAWMVSYGMS